MNAFEFASPTTKEQAVSLLSSEWGETEILAGGTDLLSLMKDYQTAPKRLVNIKEIKELQGIRYTGATGLRLGALVTLTELMENATIKSEYPSLVQSAEGVRSSQICNFGTVGGDLCQRPRCWYFRTGLGYFPKDADGKEVIPHGENQYHAILGNSGPAYFVNPSSLAPALMALEAKVRIYGAGGWREVPVEQFFVTPKNEGEREYVLKPNEILGEILVPSAKGIKNAAYEVRQREAMDWPLVAAAVALKIRGKTVLSAQVVMGHVAPVPWRSPEAEKTLAGKALDEAVATEAGKAAIAGATPLSKNGYKVQLAQVAVKRAIMRASQGGA
ncbi:MAG TPA: xanthine dehydrogenase family protein subunit M [Terriglobia bacterium]|nr:xanthine dehydrogenase family protein subunit M [Terriglobia bacterium]